MILFIISMLKLYILPFYNSPRPLQSRSSEKLMSPLITEEIRYISYLFFLFLLLDILDYLYHVYGKNLGAQLESDATTSSNDTSKNPVQYEAHGGQGCWA